MADRLAKQGATDKSNSYTQSNLPQALLGFFHLDKMGLLAMRVQTFVRHSSQFCSSIYGFPPPEDQTFLSKKKKNRSYPVVVYKREFYVYLLAIDTDEFDVILSMNWLSTFYTIIQCRNRRLVFNALNHPKFKFIKGSKLIE